MKDAVVASGRVDKRPEAKEKRKAEALANKARKKKQRDPFTREHTEWWINMFREATESQLRDMVLGKLASMCTSSTFDEQSIQRASADI